MVVERHTDTGWLLVEDAAWDGIEALPATAVPDARAANPLLDGPFVPDVADRSAWLRAAIDRSAGYVRGTMAPARAELMMARPRSWDHEHEFERLRPMRAALAAVGREMPSPPAVRRLGSAAHP